MFFETDDHDEILLYGENERAVALKRTFGKGQLIVANTPEWMTNGNILKDDHLPLLLTLLKEVMQEPFSLMNTFMASRALLDGNVYPKWLSLIKSRYY